MNIVSKAITIVAVLAPSCLAQLPTMQPTPEPTISAEPTETRAPALGALGNCVGVLTGTFAEVFVLSDSCILSNAIVTLAVKSENGNSFEIRGGNIASVFVKGLADIRILSRASITGEVKGEGIKSVFISGGVHLGNLTVTGCSGTITVNGGSVVEDNVNVEGVAGVLTVTNNSTIGSASIKNSPGGINVRRLSSVGEGGIFSEISGPVTVTTGTSLKGNLKVEKGVGATTVQCTIPNPIAVNVLVKETTGSISISGCNLNGTNIELVTGNIAFRNTTDILETSISKNIGNVAISESLFRSSVKILENPGAVTVVKSSFNTLFNVEIKNNGRVKVNGCRNFGVTSILENDGACVFNNTGTFLSLIKNDCLSEGGNAFTTTTRDSNGPPCPFAC